MDFMQGVTAAHCCVKKLSSKKAAQAEAAFSLW